jgi:hypothetical protein
MAFKKVKPERVNLKQDKNESKNDFKKRVIDAERAAYQKAAAINAEIAKQQGRNPGHHDQAPDGPGVSHQRRGFWGSSTGHHD